MLNDIGKYLADNLKDSFTPSQLEVWLAWCVAELCAFKEMFMDAFKYLPEYHTYENKPMHDGYYLVRVSDNVLDPPEWPLYMIKIVTGVVLVQHTINKGIYSYTDMLGWDTTQIFEWLDFNCTGSHPESYHEMKKLNVK